jgi:hypothetical protein
MIQYEHNARMCRAAATQSKAYDVLCLQKRLKRLATSGWGLEW